MVVDHEKLYRGPIFDTSGIERERMPGSRLVYSDLATTVFEQFRATALQAPNSEALVELGGRRLSFRQTLVEVEDVAKRLVANGVRSGDRVGIQLPNGVDWVLAFMGTLAAGAIAVPINIRLTETEIKYIVENAELSYTFGVDGELADADREVVLPKVDARDSAAIFYTSGTTGLPKGAILSHENLTSTVENCRRAADLPRGGFRSLISVPLFHVTGCNAQLLPALAFGGASVLLPKLDVGLFFDAMRDERIDLLLSVPAIYWLAMSVPEFEALDTSGVRWVLYGGAPISPDLVMRLRKAFPFSKLGNGFGMTEATALATFLPDAFATLRPETVGLAVPVVEVDIVDPDPQSGIGELKLRGQSVFKGYWKNDAANESSFQDGWYLTGDMATIDRFGFVTIVDRRKDMIIRGGENVYSIEVENAISALYGVAEVAVVGVLDPVMGEKVGAVVVPQAGNPITPESIADQLSDSLAVFKIPEYYYISPSSLPRNPAGKVLKDRYRSGVEWTGVRHPKKS